MTLTTEQIESVLTADQIATAREIGAEWGKQEVSLWHDQNDPEAEPTPRMPEWTNGTYGNLREFLRDAGVMEDDQGWDAIREAVETVIDEAAKAEWDAARA